MPSEKNVLNIIPKIYKHNFEDYSMFFFIRGQLRILPTIELRQAINSFRTETGIDEYEWATDCIRATYTRMYREFIDMKYNHMLDIKHNIDTEKRECEKENNANNETSETTK